MTQTATTPIFRADNIDVAYGAIKAVRSASLTLMKGEVVALLGANGAGKSSMLNATMGLAPRVSGTFTFKGQDISSTPTEQIAKLGLTLVFEGRRVFPKLSVSENLRLGAVAGSGQSDRKAKCEEVLDLFPILRERYTQHAGVLSGGEQQMLALARAMMSEPTMLLLDEPSLGLSPMVAQEIFAMIARLKNGGTTILIVEQNAQLGLGVADRGLVMAHGKIVGSGTSAELLESSLLADAYVGAH